MARLPGRNGAVRRGRFEGVWDGIESDEIQGFESILGSRADWLRCPKAVLNPTTANHTNTGRRLFHEYRRYGIAIGRFPETEGGPVWPDSEKV